MLPRYFLETAALWAGIQREWSNLSAKQKRQVRAYAADGHMAPMDDYMLYGKLLDLDTYEAFRHWQSDFSLASVTIMGELRNLNQLLIDLGRMRY